MSKCHDRCVCEYYKGVLLQKEMYRGLEISCEEAERWNEQAKITITYEGKVIFYFEDNDDIRIYEHLQYWENMITVFTNIDPHQKFNKRKKRKTYA